MGNGFCVPPWPGGGGGGGDQLAVFWLAGGGGGQTALTCATRRVREQIRMPASIVAVKCTLGAMRPLSIFRR